MLRAEEVQAVWLRRLVPFLEVNPGGELGPPSAAALAEALATDGGTEPRRTLENP